MEKYVVHVTKQCNMKCLYCYERDKDSTYTWKEIKNLIDNFVKYNKHFSIEYLGGEPLLAFDLLRQATEYMEDLTNKGICKVEGYGITTNGTIMTQEIVDFLKQCPKVSWAASMDGSPFMNSMRIMKDTEKNSHDLVIKNHKWLAKEIGVDRLNIHMVTHPYNIGLLSSGIDHLYKEGVRHIGIGTIESTIVIGKEYCDTYVKELDIVSKRICEGKYPGLIVGELESMKPREDVRHYIKDEEGRTLGESYGRVKEDVVSKNEETGYKAYSASSPLGEMITDIREIVYKIHQDRLKSMKASLLENAQENQGDKLPG